MQADGSTDSQEQVELPSRKAFTAKGILCLLSFAIFFGSAIALFAHLPQEIPEPFSNLRVLDDGTLIIIALVFILTALVNLVTGLVYIFMLYKEEPRPVEKKAKVEIEEVPPEQSHPSPGSKKEEPTEKPEPVPAEGAHFPERFFMRENEQIYQIIADPLADWEGEGLHSLIDALHSDQQGDLIFPIYRPIDEQQVQN